MSHLSQQCHRSFATKNLKEKASGDEKQYINKEEEKLLKNLLKKMKEDASESPEKRIQEDKAEIKKLCADHGIKYEEELADKLIKWKLGQWVKHPKMESVIWEI